MKEQSWFYKNKVFLTGLFTAICMALVEFTMNPITDWIVVFYAVFVAVGSYLVNNLRGQWITIVGIILTAAATIYASYQTKTPLDIGRLLLTIAVNIGLAVAPPGKDKGYEHTQTIVSAKREGERLTGS